MSLRSEHPALRRGTYARLNVKGDSSVAAYSLTYEDELLICVFNVGGAESKPVTIAFNNEDMRSSVICLLDSEQNPTSLAQLTDAQITLKSVLPHAFAVYSIE